jgi:uncharacterized protein (DUF2164 family)
MNKTLKAIAKEMKALLKSEQKCSGFGDNLAEHSYEQGMNDAISIVQGYMDTQSRDDIRQGRNEI